MTVMHKISRHAGLVNEMANALGVDLIDEALAGRINEARLREAVGRCVSCDASTGCERWIEAHRRGAGAPPMFCRNNDLWDLLIDKE